MKKKDDAEPKPGELENPILEEYLKKHEPSISKTKASIQAPRIIEGGLSDDQHTIFKTDLESPIPKPRDATPEQLEQWKKKIEQHDRNQKLKEEHKLSQLKLDPDPQGRKRWERKMVIRSLQKRGRITKDIKLKRTERELTYMSPFLPTSVKKLTKVMNQIAGKTVEEALVQLRFSKKKVATDVFKGLQVARDEAVLARGMGLGPSRVRDNKKKQLRSDSKPKAALKKTEDGEPTAQIDTESIQETSRTEEGEPTAQIDTESIQESPRTEEEETSNHNTQRKGTIIELKHGKKKRIDDPTEMYVDQAWVGRGTAYHSPEFRARGKVNMLTHRTTSKSAIDSLRYSEIFINMCIRFFGPTQGGKDSNAHFRRNQEEAG